MKKTYPIVTPWLEYQRRIAEHELAAEDCRKRARYDLEAYAEARHHDEEAARLRQELKDLKRNPIDIGSHPSLFGGETPVLLDWRALSPEEARRLAALGRIPTDAWNEMIEAGELAESLRGTKPLLEDGVNPELAYALSRGLMEDLEEVNESAREERIQPLVDYFRDAANAHIESETEGEGREQYIDAFQRDLESDVSSIADKVREFLEEDEYARLGEVSDELLQEVVADPALYTFEVEKDPYFRRDRAVFSMRVGGLDFEGDGTRWNETLDRLLDNIEDDDLLTSEL
jgi:hypothetical protein